MTGHAAATQAILRCREIAALSEIPGQTYRPFLCDSARQVQDLVRGWMQRAGMSVTLDAAGNLRGLYPGTNGDGKRLLIGSHLDTVPDAGAFDGVLGVVLAVAVVEQLRGQRLPFAIEVIGFSEEEGVRFGRPFLGSMALAGSLDRTALRLEDPAGITVEEALRAFGLEPDHLSHAQASDGAIGFFEVHIEQGPNLEAAGRSLGVVDRILGQTRLLLRFTGRANHAGTTPMTMRQDPVAAAAEWIVEVERRARQTAGLVATVGRIETKPGAANVIAGEVVASLDLRHASDTVRTEAVTELSDSAVRAGRSRGVTVDVQTRLEQPAVPMSFDLTNTLAMAASRAGHDPMCLSSGAGHDAMILAARIPSAMLFLRSPGGISHHPDESVREEDVAAALDTMREFLLVMCKEQTRAVEHDA